MQQWLKKVGPYTVEKIECPHPDGAVDLSKPPTGVLHTTEGDWDGAMSVFKEHYAPTFLVGPGRIAQLVPLGTMAAALENHDGGVQTNAWARAQIEVVGHSHEQAYSFDDKTEDVLAHLLFTLSTVAEIPLHRPFPDDMPPTPWATYDFARRKAGKWGHEAGWYGHVEVPENEHWDPGHLQWAKLIDAAKALEPAPKPQPVPDDPANEARLQALRNWITKQRRMGKSWDWIKKTHNWKEYQRRGGK